MTISDDIFQLIKSLNKNEKTYFKKFAQLHVLGEENNYLLLFDAIDEQEKYDEKALVEKFSKGKSTSQFSVLKNYLYNLILKALRNYHADESVKAEVKQQLQNLNILFEKGLMGQAEKVMRRSRKLAEQNEMLRELGEVMTWEQKFLLFGKSYDKKTIDAVNKNLEERILIFEKLQNMLQYDRLEYNLAMELRSPAEDRIKKAEWLMKNELLKDEKKALTITARLKYHHIFSTYYYFTGKINECISHQEKEVALLEANPDFMNLRIQDYIFLSNNLLALLMQQNEFKKFDTRLTAFRKKLETFHSTIRLWSEAIGQNYLMEMRRYHMERDYSKFSKAAQELERQLKVNKFELNLNGKFDYDDLLSQAAFSQKKFDEALGYSVQLLNHPEAPQKFQHYNMARFFNLLIHFELGNFDLLDYQIQSFQRQVMKEEKNPLYSAVIPFLKKYPSAVDRKQKHTLAEKLISDISALKNPDVPNHFDFGGWARGMSVR